MAQDRKKFEDFKLSKQLLNAIKEAGYETPTPIQEKGIPAAQSGQDVIGIAQTGTGKTAAFLLPLFHKLKYAQGTAPRALIIAPAKELAIQIFEVAKDLSKYTDLRVMCLYGGIGPTEQIKQINSGIDIIVATPGRLMDLYRKETMDLRQVKTLILDEADRLMDMGFMPQLRQLQEKMPQKKQNLLFSATFHEVVENLSEEFLDFPKRIEIAPQSSVVSNIEQQYIEVPNFKTKVNLLEHLLEQAKFDKVIVFINSKSTATTLSKYLNRKLESEVRVLHSNKSQNARINAINDFEESIVNVLVTTDVCSRGIDVKGVSHVINFELPFQYESYVHRIGRTGRADKSGVAISFCNEAELLHLKKIETLIKEELEHLSIPEDVKVEPTTKQEQIDIERVIDTVKRKEDPTFAGAFHEKKKIYPVKKTKKKR